jgi:hypothetical protein
VRWSIREGSLPRLRVAVIAATVLVLAPHAASVAAYGPIRGCPSPETVTLETLVALRGVTGPIGARIGTGLNERALGCLGSEELEFVAFVGQPEGIGGVTTFTTEPRWLDTWSLGSTWLALTSHETSPGFIDGPFMEVAVPPALQPAFADLEGRWVTVRAHFDDPLATTCMFGMEPAPEAPDQPTAADLVEMCRTSLVVSAIESIETPCGGPPLDWAAIAETLEHLRADCFGAEALTFVARGLSVFSTSPIIGIVGNDWMLLDPVRGDDEVDLANALWVFTEGDIELPDSAGTPWSNSDGVGGVDTWWRVTGHFADPRSAQCHPNPEGFISDGRLFVWSAEDALGFCRNHLVVDELEWLPNGPAVADPAVTDPASTTAASPPAAPAQAETANVASVVAAIVAIGIAIGLLLASVRRVARRR